MNRIETIAMAITAMLFFAVIAGANYNFLYVVMMGSSSLWGFLFIKRKCDGALSTDDSVGVALNMALYNAAFIAYLFNIYSIEEDGDLELLYPFLLTLAVFVTGLIIRSPCFKRRQSLSLLLKKEIDHTLDLEYHVKAFFIYYSVLWYLLCYTSIIKSQAMIYFFLPILLFIFSSLITCKLAVFICILSAFLALVNSGTFLSSMWFLSSVHFLKAVYCMVKRRR